MFDDTKNLLKGQVHHKCVPSAQSFIHFRNVWFWFAIFIFLSRRSSSNWLCFDKPRVWNTCVLTTEAAAVLGSLFFPHVIVSFYRQFSRVSEHLTSRSTLCNVSAHAVGLVCQLLLYPFSHVHTQSCCDTRWTCWRHRSGLGRSCHCHCGRRRRRRHIFLPNSTRKRLRQCLRKATWRPQE